uniref:Uncharacterized protein n=1 Tax=viral metagenome TaxID=1070528 RepID=A0A6C0F6H2_9ZZZZ
MFTVVAATMTKHTTSHDIHELFTKRMKALAQAGWEANGVPVYYPNGMTQCMTLGPVSPDMQEILKSNQARGSPVPREFVYMFGGRGPFGEKHWYESCDG